MANTGTSLQLRSLVKGISKLPAVPFMSQCMHGKVKAQRTVERVSRGSVHRLRIGGASEKKCLDTTP